MGILDAVKEKIAEKNRLARIDAMIKPFIQDPNKRVDKKGIKNIVDAINEQEINYPFPKALIVFMREERKTDKLEDILEVYIRHKRNSGRESRNLEKAKKLGVKKVKIRTCQDKRVCSICKKHANKSYDIEKVPQIPLCWDCRCYYEPIIK